MRRGEERRRRIDEGREGDRTETAKLNVHAFRKEDGKEALQSGVSKLPLVWLLAQSRWPQAQTMVRSRKLKEKPEAIVDSVTRTPCT